MSFADALDRKDLKKGDFDDCKDQLLKVQRWYERDMESSVPLHQAESFTYLPYCCGDGIDNVEFTECSLVSSIMDGSSTDSDEIVEDTKSPREIFDNRLQRNVVGLYNKGRNPKMDSLKKTNKVGDKLKSPITRNAETQYDVLRSKSTHFRTVEVLKKNPLLCATSVEPKTLTKEEKRKLIELFYKSVYTQTDAVDVQFSGKEIKDKNILLALQKTLKNILIEKQHPLKDHKIILKIIVSSSANVDETNKVNVTVEDAYSSEYSTHGSQVTELELSSLIYATESLDKIDNKHCLQELKSLDTFHTISDCEKIIADNKILEIGGKELSHGGPLNTDIKDVRRISILETENKNKKSLNVAGLKLNTNNTELLWINKEMAANKCSGKLHKKSFSKPNRSRKSDSQELYFPVKSIIARSRINQNTVKTNDNENTPCVLRFWRLVYTKISTAVQI